MPISESFLLRLICKVLITGRGNERMDRSRAMSSTAIAMFQAAKS